MNYVEELIDLIVKMGNKIETLEEKVEELERGLN